MRYSHWIQPSKKTGYPTMVAGIGVDLSPTGEVDYLGRPRYSLTRWCVASRMTEYGTLGKVKLWHGESLASLLTALSKAPAKTRSLWLVSSQPRRTMLACELFNSEKQQPWTITSASTSAKHPSRRRSSSQQAPTVILGMPPVIIRMESGDTKYPITLLSTQNWGIEHDPEWTTPELTASGCLLAVSDLIDASRTMDWGGLKLTASGVGWHVWRYRDYDTPVHCHCVPEVLKLERKCIYGGRCEALKSGKFSERMYHLDFRGLYPFVASESQVPCALVRGGKESPAELLAREDSRAGFIAQVRVVDPAGIYPSRSEGKTVYQAGPKGTVLCGDELRRAVRDGHVVSFGSWAEYRLGDPLRRTLQRWRSLRSESSVAGSVGLKGLCKAAANSLIGRFAARESRWQYVPDGASDVPYGEWFVPTKSGRAEKRRALDWTVWREIDEGIGPDAVPILNAWITSAARSRLWDAMSVCPAGSLWYTDTDSLIVTQAGYDALRAAGWVRHGIDGFLTIREIADEGEIFGPKHYRFGPRLCHGGVVQDEDCQYPVW